MQTLRSVVADAVPHPLGTRANARVRSRIETHFRSLGYETTLQRRFACNAAAMCGEVTNIIARPRGAAARGEIVMLVSHYDSVPAGAGASDDGMGVATMLEVARAIRGERFRNRVAFLIDDGEEAGLLGAEAFTADPVLMRDVAVVINVEMRGTHGASNMFETSRGNRWLIRHLARALRQPQASSLFYTIYELLPNDTDVTVFKRAGTAAVNFGGVRGVNWYHTPLDDLAHASPRTLQHHGDNVLSTLRVVGNADLAARSATDATYFDVLGMVLVWWPQEWTVWIAIASLVALLVAARRVPPRAMTFGVLTAFAAILFAAFGGVAVAWLANMRLGDVRFVAHPLASVVAMWLTGLSAALFAASLFSRHKDPEAMLYGVAIAWHAIGVALALTLPGTAYLFVVPALIVSICALADAPVVLTSAFASTAAAIVLFPLGIMLYDALGSRMMSAIAVVIGIFATLVAPLFARRRYAAPLLIIALACAGLAAWQPASTREKPRALPIAYADDPAAPSPQWVVPEVSARMGAFAKFTQSDSALTPWSRWTSWSAPATPLGLQRVSVTAKRDGRRVTVRVRSQRNADRLTLFVRGATVRTVNGTVLPPRPARFRERTNDGWRVAAATGVAEMVVVLDAERDVQLVASDVSYALPASGRALARARDASDAITIQDGDVTITRSRAKV